MNNHKTPIIAVKLSLRGTVQAVGFRPTIHRLAASLRLAGTVANTADGAEIILEGRSDAVAAFENTFREHLPPAAHIESMTRRTIPVRGLTIFSICATRNAARITADIPADLALCSECLREFSDPDDRRFHYPFINCTNCGPRFSIVTGLPYDRPKTTMDSFAMCPDCAREYSLPASRRFHAQPNACPVCGPQVTLRDKSWNSIAHKHHAVTMAVQALREGKILAVKSLGGYHLACDAMNEEAIICLRIRKNRPHKPFALMMPDIETVREFCELSPAEQTLLLSAAHPIVLLRKKIHVAQRPMPLYRLAPDNAYIGVMLPYTPLHHLLFQPAVNGEPPVALVMTSGNRADEPICRTEAEARARLAGIADSILTHNRVIHNRVDDSIVQVVPGSNATIMIRRSRGYVPQPIGLTIPKKTPTIFAAGAELKNTFCLTRNNNAYLSQHIGDLDNADAETFYAHTVMRTRSFLQVTPAAAAHDCHPDYRSTIFAGHMKSCRASVPAVAIQHHHAHIASVMAEHHLSAPLTGIAFDGTGLGTDNTVWGGECFTVTAGNRFDRVLHLDYFALPGGDVAVREIWRLAASLLMQAGITNIPAHLARYPIRDVRAMIAQNIQCPRCCSAGRLFDAVAAIIGIRTECTFEAQAAIEMEALAIDTLPEIGYTVSITDGAIELKPVIREIWSDFKSGMPPFEISGKFHATLAGMIVAMARRGNNPTVALSGGVFQNRILLAHTEQLLSRAGFAVYYNNRVPINDGGIALGQAYLAAIERT